MFVKGVTPYLADLGGGKNLLFVKVETEGGPHGWGECYTQADRDASIVAHVEALGRYLVGRDASHITHFVHMAYNDFAAKRGAMESPRVPVSASSWTKRRSDDFRAASFFRGHCQLRQPKGRSERALT